MQFKDNPLVNIRYYTVSLVPQFLIIVMFIRNVDKLTTAQYVELYVLLSVPVCLAVPFEMGSH